MKQKQENEWKIWTGEHDLHFWEDEPERISLRLSKSLILSCSFWKVWPILRLLQWHEN